MLFWAILIFAVIMNLLAFLFFGIDKWRSIHGAWRISEKTLLALAFLGGGIGAWSGMLCFRHKTKHPLFWLGIPIVVFLEALVVLYLLFKL